MFVTLGVKSIVDFKGVYFDAGSRKNLSGICERACSWIKITHSELLKLGSIPRKAFTTKEFFVEFQASV